MHSVIEIKKEGDIAEIILNRKERYNAFDLEMVCRLSEQLANMAVDNAVSGIVITGNGHAFCAGGDLKWAVTFSDNAGHSFRKLASQFHLAVTEIRRMKKPVVAAINGIAAGGGFSLALACDFRIMEKSAILRQAYTASGLSIDGGGTFTLPRIVGLARAMEIAAFDPPISAKQALEWGLVTKVVEDGSSLEASVILLQQLADKCSPHSFGWSKRLIGDSFNHSFESHIEWEREGLFDCSESPDGREGLKAFMEKRKPMYRFMKEI